MEIRVVAGVREGGGVGRGYVRFEIFGIYFKHTFPWQYCIFFK